MTTHIRRSWTKAGRIVDDIYMQVIGPRQSTSLETHIHRSSDLDKAHTMHQTCWLECIYAGCWATAGRIVEDAYMQGIGHWAEAGRSVDNVYNHVIGPRQDALMTYTH